MICGLIDNDPVGEDHYHLAVEACVEKCKHLGLITNKKTKEMIISRGKTTPSAATLCIENTQIERAVQGGESVEICRHYQP